MTDSPSATNGYVADDKPAATDDSTHAASAPPQPPAAAFSLRRNIQQLPPISATLCVALGGALGALLRYGFIRACATYQAASTASTATDGTTTVTLHKPFPLSTFVSNMLGCLLIGLLSILLPFLAPSPSALLLWRSLLVTGFLGALTTMSSFVLDTAQLWEHQRSRQQDDAGVEVVQDGDGREWVGALYWLSTNVGGMGLVVIGRRIARWVERRCVRFEKRKADSSGTAERQVQASNAQRAVVREAAAEHKEQAMMAEGESVDAKNDKQ